MRARKSLVALSAAAGLIASTVVSASPASAASKSCYNVLAYCKTGTLAANSTSHAATFCGKPLTTGVQVFGFDKDTGRQVTSFWTWNPAGQWSCKTVGGLYGENYYAMISGDGWASISN